MPYVRQPETSRVLVQGSVAITRRLRRHDERQLVGRDRVRERDVRRRRAEWTVELRVADGSTRIMHPKHIVTRSDTPERAGDPRLPPRDFAGQVIHSSKFRTGAGYRGKRVMVIGTATSGHDISLIWPTTMPPSSWASAVRRA